MRPIKYILIHDSVPADPLNESHPSDVLNCGYHYIVNSKGLVFNAIDIHKPGAFLEGYDACSIGIQYNGSLKNDYPLTTLNSSTDSKLSTINSKLLTLLTLIVDLRSHFLDAKILGVSEIYGKDIRPSAEMNRLRRELSDEL